MARLMVERLNNKDSDFDARFTAVLSAGREADTDVNAVVADIINDVRVRGDEAVVEYTNRFDRVQLKPADMAFTADDMAKAEAEVDAETGGRWARRGFTCPAARRHILLPF